MAHMKTKNGKSTKKDKSATKLLLGHKKLNEDLHVLFEAHKNLRSIEAEFIAAGDIMDKEQQALMARSIYPEDSNGKPATKEYGRIVTRFNKLAYQQDKALDKLHNQRDKVIKRIDHLLGY
jgi:hypothetical protein